MPWLKLFQARPQRLIILFKLLGVKTLKKVTELKGARGF